MHGDQFNCALTGDGQVMCWGDNESQTIGPLTLGKIVPKPTAIVW